jgi:hypothetical protein
MAGAHGRWLAVLFSGLDEKEMETMMALLAKAKLSARDAVARGEVEIS